MRFCVTGTPHTAAKWLGLLSGAVGTVAVTGALLGGWAAGRFGAARIFWLGLIGGGGFLALFSRMTVFPVATVIVALAGLMFGALNAAAPPLFLAVIPQNLIGRVMAVFNPFQQLAGISSMAVAGFLASTVLSVGTIFGVSALLIVAAGCAVIVPLRGVGRSTAESEPLTDAYR